MKDTNRCQSCYMEMKEPKDFGTEANESASADYCCHCYQKGAFTDNQTFEEAVESNIPWWKEDSDKSNDEARARIMDVFPTLKRWKMA